MGVVAEVGRTWVAPRAAALRQFAQGPQEARSLAILMGGCALVWLAQWPRLQREALTAPAEGPDFAQLVGTALFGWLMVLPLAFYLVAGITHAASRALGGRGEGWQARRAMFWAWLAATPAALATGIAVGLTGGSVLANLIGFVWVGAFALFWTTGQRAASLGPRSA